MSSDFPNRRSVRLRGYDYAEAGAYFITICTTNRAPLFGHITDDRVVLSPLGVLVAEEWQRTPALRSNIDIDAFVIMPDHIHGILVVTERDPRASVPPQSGEPGRTARTI
jgi:REP element-mobilizing transposase RayT